MISSRKENRYDGRQVTLPTLKQGTLNTCRGRGIGKTPSKYIGYDPKKLGAMIFNSGKEAQETQTKCEDNVE